MSEFSFSVLIATYEGDDPDDLERALQSVINQTVQPDEIVVVADGPLTSELEGVLDDLDEKHPDLFCQTSLSNNCGLGAALKHGVEVCSYEWIARMDADDVAVEDRFERQLEYINEHPGMDVVGGYIREFDENPDCVNRVREVPTTHEEIAAAGRFRCPMNHPSVMFRRRAVIDAGNYQEYGFISRDDPGRDVFAHIRDIESGVLAEGIAVQFELTMGERGPRAQSIRCVETD